MIFSGKVAFISLQHSNDVWIPQLLCNTRKRNRERLEQASLGNHHADIMPLGTSQEQIDDLTMWAVAPSCPENDLEHLSSKYDLIMST